MANRAGGGELSTADAAFVALDAGENLRAYELATAALARKPHDRPLVRAAVLASGKSGALDAAESLLQDLDVGVDDMHAWLARERAVHAGGDDRRRWAAVAADRYTRSTATETSRSALVDLAVMALLAGETERAHHAASAALAAPSAAGERADGEAAYGEAATRAEAYVVLGDIDAAVRALSEAHHLAGDDVAPRARTRRRLRALLDERVAPVRLLEQIPVPGVVAFGGHRLADEPAAEARLRADIEAVLDRRRAAVGYGSLACGADILWAEALLERGAAVHIVFPFDPNEFVETSVRPGGDAWVGRHHAILEAATSVTVAWDGEYQGHDELYGLAAALFLGRARVHAEQMTAAASFGVIWDGEVTDGHAGTGADVAKWQRRGGELDIIAPRGTRVRGAHRPKVGPELVVGAAIVGQIDGANRQGSDEIIAAVNAEIDRAGDSVLYTKIAEGDVFVVFRSAVSGAALALDTQAAVRRASRNGYPVLGLSLAGHAGPIIPLRDPAQDQTTYSGAAVDAAAAIEPRTPWGEVYVTEPFAALLALEPAAGIATEYVGHLATSNDLGDWPMYVLRR